MHLNAGSMGNVGKSVNLASINQLQVTNQGSGGSSGGKVGLNQSFDGKQ